MDDLSHFNRSRERLGPLLRSGSQADPGSSHCGWSLGGWTALLVGMALSVLGGCRDRGEPLRVLVVQSGPFADWRRVAFLSDATRPEVTKGPNNDLRPSARATPLIADGLVLRAQLAEEGCRRANPSWARGVADDSAYIVVHVEYPDAECRWVLLDREDEAALAALNSRLPPEFRISSY